MENQISIGDVFSDLFNEAEVLRELLRPEIKEDCVISEHNQKKAKRESKFESLPVEIIEYKLADREKICDTCDSLLTEMKKEVRSRCFKI